jgi:hypothetical protein
MNTRRLLMQIAISAGVAIVTPAAAAGLIEGVSAAATTVADATAPNQSIYPDQGADAETAPAAVATHAPTRLSALAGSDATAWADVGHPVHVSRKPH